MRRAALALGTVLCFAAGCGVGGAGGASGVAVGAGAVSAAGTTGAVGASCRGGSRG